ncbi:hypothetical protein OC835_003541 [Tilletia horrida]|nr:hypothetical protein OC835_003541 [Tilletia horrida]
MSRSPSPTGNKGIPEPGDDAPPLMVRVVVSVGAYRSLRDYDWIASTHTHSSREQAPNPLAARNGGASLNRDEFKLYLWRNSTMRDVVRLVHAAAHLARHAISRQPGLCSPLALHGIRFVFFDSRKDGFVAREMARDVARVSVAEYTSALLGSAAAPPPLPPSSSTITSAEEQQRQQQQQQAMDELLLDEEKAVLQRLRQRDRPSEAARTLRKSQLRDGDVIECVILPDETVAVPATAAVQHAAASSAYPAAAAASGWSGGRGAAAGGRPGGGSSFSRRR